MGTKMGRPTLNPRVVNTRIRMTKEESEMLRKCADRLQITKTEVVIMGIQKIYDNIFGN